MKLKPNFAKIVGTPTETRDSWVVVEDGFSLLLEINDSLDSSVAVLGKNIIEEILAKLSSLEDKNLASLKKLLAEVSLPEGTNFSLICGVQKETVFYLFCRGAGKVTLRREGKFGVILDGEGAVSGSIKNNDLFVLTLPRFNEIVTAEELRTGFDNFSVSEIADGLTTLSHRAEDTSGVAALILEFEEVEKESWLLEEEEGEEEKKSPTGFSGNEAAPRWAGYLFTLKKISQNLFSVFRRSTAIYLRVPQDEEGKKKRVIFWVAIILLGLLFISIAMGFSRRESSRKASQFNQAFDLASHQFEEGKALAGVNNLRAVSLLTEAKESLETAKKDFVKDSTEAKKIGDLQESISKELEVASQIYKEAGELFMDLGLIKDGGQGVRLAVSGQNLMIVDKKASLVYQLSIKSKSSQILAGGDDLRGASLLAASEEQVFILADRGILELKLGLANKELKTVVKKDEDWGEIVDLEVFGGNLYLLDKSKGKVWKYAVANGFSAKTNYLASDYNLSNPLSMAVDGSVWLAAGKILKFAYGKEDTFNLTEANSGLGSPLADNLLIVTSEKIKNLYVLDKKNKRLVVFEKSGAYVAQYLWEEIGMADDFVVSEDKEVFLLLGSKIYKISLR